MKTILTTLVLLTSMNTFAQSYRCTFNDMDNTKLPEFDSLEVDQVEVNADGNFKLFKTEKGNIWVTLKPMKNNKYFKNHISVSVYFDREKTIVDGQEVLSAGTPSLSLTADERSEAFQTMSGSGNYSMNIFCEKI
ncbi:MAG: hypothetical protein ACOYL6_19290 [Bacteriovoracaceae bacterium]